MEIYTHIVIPLLIFVARIIDVSLGTIRVLFISKGKKIAAAVLGFIEVLIWLIAIKEILNNLTSVMAYIAYPAGFAAGTYIGMLIEERLIEGKQILRIIFKKGHKKIIKAFEEEEIPYTLVDAHGSRGKTEILFCILDKNTITDAINLVKKHNPKAIYTLENVRDAKQPITNTTQKKTKKTKRYFFYRKGK